MHDMFRLWCLGEEDLLSETVAYKLTDTGQGKQRVQYSPRTFKAMQVKSPSCQGSCDDGTYGDTKYESGSALVVFRNPIVLPSFNLATKPSICAFQRL